MPLKAHVAKFPTEILLCKSTFCAGTFNKDKELIMTCCVSRNFVDTFGHQWPGALIFKTFKHFSCHSVLSIVGVKWSNSGSIYFQSLLDKLPPPHSHPVKLKVQKYRYLMRGISQAINTSSLAAQSLQKLLSQHNVAHDVVTKTCLCSVTV